MGTYREYRFKVREEDASNFELKIIDLTLLSLKEKGILKPNDILSEKAMDEIYSFIIDSNYEQQFIAQLNNKTTQKELQKWLQIDDEGD